MKPRALVVPLVAAFAVLSCSHEDNHAPRSASSHKTQQTRTSEVSQTTEVTSAVTMPSESGPEGRRVREVVESHLAEVVDRCGGQQVASDRYLTTLHFEIAPSGSVETVKASGNEPRVDACVAEAARAWQFGASSGRTVTNVVLELNRPAHGK